MSATRPPVDELRALSRKLFSTRPPTPEILTAVGAALCALSKSMETSVPTRIEHSILGELLRSLDRAIGHLESANTVGSPESLQQLRVALAHGPAFLHHFISESFDTELRIFQHAMKENELRGDLLRGVLSTRTDPSIGRNFTYDDADTFVEALLELPQTPFPTRSLQEGMLAYQPTCVRMLLMAVEAMAAEPPSVIVDLGSGIGRTGLLLHLLTGCKVVQVEYEKKHSRYGADLAIRFNLKEVDSWQGDAQEFDYGVGDYFFLFNPFGGDIFERVIEKLRERSLSRPFAICSLGHCSVRFRKESWLNERSGDAEGVLCIFESQ